MAYTEYNAVVADDAASLVLKLTARIAEGWQPFGSPVSITEGFQVLQAVVKGSADGGGGAPGDITAGDITDASTVGKTMLTCADEAAARAAIGAGTSSFSGSFDDLSEKPTIPTAIAAGDAAKLEAGSDTVQRSWSAKMISDEIKRQVAATVTK
ncbi:DUF1737 domain-containing protein [Pseudomonas sp. NA-150]|uniref:DUF1737 domain-containing protein n=1 Tax=Pseudomonas sp. NA-150 TaxID=3367525 RepID=UPI0037C5DA74